MNAGTQNAGFCLFSPLIQAGTLVHGMILLPTFQPLRNTPRDLPRGVFHRCPKQDFGSGEER